MNTNHKNKLWTFAEPVKKFNEEKVKLAVRNNGTLMPHVQRDPFLGVV
jgi:hypothetical protein